MAQKIDMKKNVYKKSVRKNEQEKLQYNNKVKKQYFTSGNFVFFRILTPYLGKLIKK